MYTPAFLVWVAGPSSTPPASPTQGPCWCLQTNKVCEAHPHVPNMTAAFVSTGISRDWSQFNILGNCST
jgi:hypothetical protein